MRSRLLDLEGRPTLARLAQRVAEGAAGWVFVEFRRRPSAELLHHLEAAGRCVRSDDSAFYLDAAATGAWIGHPDFFVIK